MDHTSYSGHVPTCVLRATAAVPLAGPQNPNAKLQTARHSPPMKTRLAARTRLRIQGQAAKLQCKQVGQIGRELAAPLSNPSSVPATALAVELRRARSVAAFHTMTASRTSFFSIACITMHGQHKANSAPARLRVPIV